MSLSGGEVLQNPDLDMAHELKGWWDNEGVHQVRQVIIIAEDERGNMIYIFQETTSMTVAGSRGEGGSSGGANLKLLGEVKQENLGQSIDKPDYYSTNATITFFRLVREFGIQLITFHIVLM